MDEGYCLDYHGHYYSSLMKYFSNKFTAFDCGSWCLQNPSFLVGIDFYNDPSGLENGCYCLFNDGIPPVIGTYNPPFTKIRLNDVGVGPIANVSGHAHWICYQNDVSVRCDFLEAF
jgi:hypothetical protein